MKCEFCGVEASVCRICYDNMEQAFSYKIEQIQAENEKYKSAINCIINNVKIANLNHSFANKSKHEKKIFKIIFDLINDLKRIAQKALGEK